MAPGAQEKFLEVIELWQPSVVGALKLVTLQTKGENWFEMVAGGTSAERGLLCAEHFSVLSETNYLLLSAFLQRKVFIFPSRQH